MLDYVLENKPQPISSASNNALSVIPTENGEESSRKALIPTHQRRAFPVASYISIVSFRPLSPLPSILLPCGYNLRDGMIYHAVDEKAALS